MRRKKRMLPVRGEFEFVHGLDGRAQRLGRRLRLCRLAFDGSRSVHASCMHISQLAGVGNGRREVAAGTLRHLLCSCAVGMYSIDLRVGTWGVRHWTAEASHVVREVDPALVVRDVRARVVPVGLADRSGGTNVSDIPNIQLGRPLICALSGEHNELAVSRGRDVERLQLVGK